MINTITIKVFGIILTLLMPCVMYSQSNLKIGHEAPEIHIDKWLLNKPKNRSTKDRFVVLDFWATWCQPCLRNVPHINELQANFANENILFLQMTSESPKVAKSAFDRVDFRTPVVTDKKNRTHINYGNGLGDLAYYPMAVLIDDQNIIRWYGSSTKLNKEMISMLLNRENIDVPQTSPNGPNSVARDPETYTNREFSLRLWSDLWHDPNITFRNYIEESPSDTIKSFDSYTSTGAIVQNKSLRSILKLIYPQKTFIIPEPLSEKNYNFYFVNKDLNADSDDLLIQEIAGQLDLDVKKSMTNGYHIEIHVNNPSLLMPPTTTKRWAKSTVENNRLSLPKNTITDLANALTRESDHYFTSDTPSSKRYQFNDIDLASYKSIKSSLKKYGLRLKEIDTAVEMYLFTERSRE